MSTLATKLVITPTGSGRIGLVFELTNPSDADVTITYFAPFTAFELSATASDGNVQIVQPSYESPVRPVTTTISPGQSSSIEPPFRLRFDPDGEPSGGDVATIWSLVHSPAPVLLRATIHVEDAELPPCEALWTPA